MDIKEIAEQVELLNEAGEPVLYAEFAEDGGWLGDASEYADHLEEPHALFTSDQLAAAIIKATKPLEDQLAAEQEEIQKLRQDLLTSYGESEELSGQLVKAEQRVVRQYYFKNNSCKAESAHDPDCICWHDEGTGPMQPLLDGTYLVQMTWRKFVKEV